MQRARASVADLKCHILGGNPFGKQLSREHESPRGQVVSWSSSRNLVEVLREARPGHAGSIGQGVQAPFLQRIKMDGVQRLGQFVVRQARQDTS